MMSTIHRSIDYDRVEQAGNYSLEVAFAESWESVNEEQPGLNHGLGILQALMMNRRDHWSSPQCRLLLTRRDAAVAATAIQWLGTNVGSSWLAETLKKADYRLLHPSERHHERDLAAWKKIVDERDVRARDMERNAQIRERDLGKWELDLDQRERRMAEEQRNFLALLLLANVRLFRRTEPTAKRRQIALADE